MAPSISSFPMSNHTTTNKKKLPQQLMPKIKKAVDSDDSDDYETELKQNEMQVCFLIS